MKFANQTIRRADQTPTKDSGVISLSLLLLSNSELNVKSLINKILECRKVYLYLLGVLYSEQLNRKNVRE